MTARPHRRRPELPHPRPPEAAHNHPTEEHLLPFYVALGAGAGRVDHLHQSTTYGFLRMDACAFGAVA